MPSPSGETFEQHFITDLMEVELGMHLPVGIPLSQAATAEARHEIDAGNFYLKLHVEFGTELLGSKQLSKSSLAELLKSESEVRPGFASDLLRHIAGHMQLHLDLNPNLINDPAPSDVSTGYRGCGSCDPGCGCMGQICYWYDGTSTCEECGI